MVISSYERTTALLEGIVKPALGVDSILRHSVFDHFLTEGTPPSVERLMGELQLPRDEVESGLDRLETARHIQLVPRTHRILMAFPFSAIATPFRVRLADGRSYFANCAWDAVAFHVMLRQPVWIDSYCYHCGKPLSFQVSHATERSEWPASPLVYLALPAAAWWKDIISTCANTMVFFGSIDHFREWQSAHPGAQGAELAIETVVQLSEPLYSGKLDIEYTRPSRERLLETFHELGLSGTFWEI